MKNQDKKMTKAFKHLKHLKVEITESNVEEATRLVHAVGAFSNIMTERLIQKVGEGFMGWEKANPIHIKAGILASYDSLAEALKADDYRLAIKKAADVAAFAMFLTSYAQDKIKEQTEKAIPKCETCEITGKCPVEAMARLGTLMRMPELPDCSGVKNDVLKAMEEAKCEGCGKPTDDTRESADGVDLCPECQQDGKTEHECGPVGLALLEDEPGNEPEINLSTLEGDR